MSPSCSELGGRKHSLLFHSVSYPRSKLFRSLAYTLHLSSGD